MIPLERMDVRDALAAVEPFVETSAVERDRLAQRAVRVRKASGARVLREGETADGLYVVLRGRVNLVREADGGRDLILSVLGTGDVFGETCACGGVAMSSAAVTSGPTELLWIPAEDILAHARRQPETLVRMMRLLGDKLRDMENVASGLALCDVEERLRRTLARLARRQGRKTIGDDAGWILAPVPTQSELAKMVGSCRETVSRTLSAMARSGLLSASGRRMVLSDALLGEAA